MSIPKFYDRAVDSGATGEDGRPTYRLATYFLHQIDANRTVEREARDEDKEAWPAEYAAYDRTRQPDTGGFPLSAWHGVNAAERQGLEDRGIFTVEKLAETEMARAPQDLRDLQGKAREFLATTSADAPKLAARIAELEEENEALKEQAEDMRQAIEALKAEAAKGKGGK